MTLNEEEMLFLEKQIPELAETAIKQAYFRALSAGYTVVERRGDAIVETSPDGKEKIVKKISPPIPVIISKLEIS